MVPKLQEREALLLGLIPAVGVLLRDEQTDHTRHLRTLEKTLERMRSRNHNSSIGQEAPRAASGRHH